MDFQPTTEAGDDFPDVPGAAGAYGVMGVSLLAGGGLLNLLWFPVLLFVLTLVQAERDSKR